jgi:hypothetical protein
MNALNTIAASLAAALVSLPVAAAAADPVLQAPASPDSSEGGAAPFQLSLWDSVQVVDAGRPIHGLRLALPYGRNLDVRGLDVGIVSAVDRELEGVQLSVVGIVDGNVRGLQYNWLWGSAGGLARGAQISAVNTAGTLEGAQLGAVNYVRGDAGGVGLGIVNVFEGATTGAQLGGVNYAPRIEGFQLGFVNVTGHLRGVQIGLVNVASNGFLPVFPIVNAAL